MGAGSVLQFVVFILKKINCLQHKVNIRDKTRIIGGSCRVTLSVAFDFLAPNCGRLHGPINGTLSMNAGSVAGTHRRGQDTQTLPVVIKFI